VTAAPFATVSSNSDSLQQKGVLRMRNRRRRDDSPPSTDPDKILQWDRDEIFPGFWQELLAQPPAGVCSRSGASYVEEEGAYLVRMLDRVYRVYPAGSLILVEPPTENPEHLQTRVSFTESLVLVIYLLRSRHVPPTGKRVTERELPGGNLFFRGPHELPREPVLSRYGQDPRGFLRAGKALQGEPVPLGDAGVRFQILPRIPVECILWAGDQEFSPSLTYVFDASASDHLPLDVIWALVALLAARLAGVSA